MSPSQKPTRRTPSKSARPLGQSRTKPWVRMVVVAVVVVLVVGTLVALFANNDSGSSKSSSSGTTATTGTPATTGATMPSAAGKPCVAEAPPLPPGAPAVPVEVGPAPAQLVTKDLQVGTGETVSAGANITVDYVGVSCSTGKVFDTSYGKQPATFSLDGVIPGWTKGIPGMKVGGTRLLGIPASDAYGATGSPPVIAPDEALWFVVQLKTINPAAG
ncbi:MAG TPA: FKBP-type peptidyl-prolyl cis-trans isomerase [Acidimicrobiia bacterium]